MFNISPVAFQQCQLYNSKYLLYIGIYKEKLIVKLLQHK